MNPSEAEAAWGAYEASQAVPDIAAAAAAAVAANLGIDNWKPDPVHYRPFAEAADSFVREAQMGHRFYTGIPDFDDAMRGLSPGHLGVIVGYSHSGKTLLLLEMLKNSPQAKVAWFVPDEPRTLTLAKLTSLVSGVPARQLEELVANGDRDAIALLRSTAEEEFPHLAVFDKTLTRDVLYRGYDEAAEAFDGIDLVVVDYVDLVQGAEVVPQKFDILKSFVSDKNAPMWAIHQTARSSGAEGKAMTISSGNYGGEQHATMMIGVWRKKAAIMASLLETRDKILRSGATDALVARKAELEHDLAIHEYTLTANVVKNKRPGGGLVDERDFELFGDTGQIVQLEPEAYPRQFISRQKAQGKPVTAPQTAVDANGGVAVYHEEGMFA